MKKIISIILVASLLAALIITTSVQSFAKEANDISSQISETLPAQFDTTKDMFEVEDVFDETGDGFIHNTHEGGFDYYFVKGEYGKTYMTFKFRVEEAGTYDFCIGLMAIGSSVPRTCEFDINGEERYYVKRMYDFLAIDKAAPEYITGITAYLRKGENWVTVYTGYDFDNVNVKSVFVDKIFYHRTGDLPDGYKFPSVDYNGESTDITGAEPTIFKFNENFKRLITGNLYCKYSFVEDETFGNVARFTISDKSNSPQFSFSYSKYLTLLGLDSDTKTCDEYSSVVLAVKADEKISEGVVKFYPYTNGKTLLSEKSALVGNYESGKGWQYVIFDVNEMDVWEGSLTGGTIFIANKGEETGATVDVAELRFFKTHEEAASFVDSKANKKSSGCGGVISLPVVVFVAIAGAGITRLRRKTTPMA